ncbi:hypothetical protein BJP36_38835 [Moorena producens JHB]|uniref:Uncharacterized protein n=1 Tax=Moorena producens (strain JHB) TaxID=1454205 RepID=A0A9Q9SUR9_MOOP1|nr:hypothetical protein [Moorena producens]WAN70027.1 hypothetical protein BJP36_38835 [Moorena producens JHB]
MESGVGSRESGVGSRESGVGSKIIPISPSDHLTHLSFTRRKQLYPCSPEALSVPILKERAIPSSPKP